MLLVALLANAASAKEFVAGEEAPVCASFRGKIAGLTSDRYDWVCHGAYKIIGKNEANAGYYVQVEGRNIEVGSRFLGEVITEAQLPSAYAPSVKVGEDLLGCKPQGPLSCKVVGIARVPQELTYSYYVKFEGQDLWFHHLWFSYSMNIMERRMEALKASQN